MWTQDNSNAGTDTSSSAAAMSPSDVVNGSPECGFRISGA